MPDAGPADGVKHHRQMVPGLAGAIRLGTRLTAYPADGSVVVVSAGPALPLSRAPSDSPSWCTSRRDSLLRELLRESHAGAPRSGPRTTSSASSDVEPTGVERVSATLLARGHGGDTTTSSSLLAFLVTGFAAWCVGTGRARCGGCRRFPGSPWAGLARLRCPGWPAGAGVCEGSALTIATDTCLVRCANRP